MHGVGQGHTADYICLQCMQTFSKLKRHKAHIRETGHKNSKEARAMIAANDVSPPDVPPSKIVSTKCLQCQEEIPLGQSHARCRMAKPPQRKRDNVNAVRRLTTGYHSRDVHVNSYEHADWQISTGLQCPTCKAWLGPSQTLQEHYRESRSHLKCRPCLLGFPNLSAYAQVRSLHFYEQRVDKTDEDPLRSTRLFAPRRRLRLPQARMQSRSSQ